MSYKTIVAIVRGSADVKHVLEAAMPLIRADDAHVTAVHAEPSAAAYVSVVGGEMVSMDEAAIEAGRQRMQHVRELFEEECRREGISHEWRGLETYAGDSAAAARTTAHAADLVIAQQPDPDQPDDTYADFETLLFEGGRPVLFVPYIECKPIDPKHVVIAWKDGKEAARAVFDSLPLLKRAQKVTVVVVDPRENEDHSATMAAADIANSLARHGINVEVRNETSAGLPVGDVIANYMSDSGADLLVMGGYSRSPIRELLFGGATRSTLKSMATPVLMSH